MLQRRPSGPLQKATMPIYEESEGPLCLALAAPPADRALREGMKEKAGSLSMLRTQAPGHRLAGRLENSGCCCNLALLEQYVCGTWLRRSPSTSDCWAFGCPAC